MKKPGTSVHQLALAHNCIKEQIRNTPSNNSANSNLICDISGYTYLVLLVFFALFSADVKAQISYATAGADYTQNFDNLYVTVPANNTIQPASILPAGWVFVEAGANANTSIRNDNGSSGTGDTYLDGATNSNERSIGSFSSGSLTTQFGASFINTTGSTLTQFTISYTGEQWKDGGSGSAVLNTLSFAYSIGASSLTAGAYTNVTQLDFLAVVNNTTADVTLDGNNPVNQRAISYTVTGISWPSGTTIFIRWTDINDPGNDDNLAIDDVTFKAISCTAPVIASINSNTPICANETLNLNVDATGNAPLSYQWVGAGTFTSATVSNPSVNFAATGSYTVTVTNACGSSTAGLGVIINANVTPSVSIAASPASTICSGTNVVINATELNGGTSPNFEFFLNNISVQSGASNSYSSGSLLDADEITCILTSNATCQTASTANSNTVTINVASSVLPAVTIASNTASTICAGTSVTFTATPVNEGAAPVYQWKLNGNDVGTNSESYSNTALADQDVVSCMLTSSNSCASPATAISNNITIAVAPNETPSVSITADPGNSLCEGTVVTFDATPVNAGTPTYQWTKNGNIAGNNSASFVDASLVNNDAIECTITSSETCVTSATAVSNIILMSVNPMPNPSVTGTFTFCTGSATVLDAGAGYTSYEWSTGETSPTISVTSGGSYAVTVSNGICTATSLAVNVNEISVPAQPGAFTVSSANVNTGQNGVVYTIPDVSGVTYVWNYSGTGATINGSANSVTVDFSGSATSGILSVTANNFCGSGLATSLPVTVTERPDMRITEYQYNGSEFVEFTNIGSSSVDMTGWSYDDNSRMPGSFSLTAFGTVQAGESVILSEETEAAFRTRWNVCSGVKVIGGSTQNLGRADEVNLYDASGLLVDRLTYDDQTLGGPRTDVKSAWVPGAALGNNNSALWVASTVADTEGSYTSVTGSLIASPGKSTRATVAFDPCVTVSGAPTIVMNVSATSDYGDGGLLVSPPTPYGLSGVIDDITDPASSFGIDFTIDDDATPVGSLIVTVSSNNQTVVPNANLNLTGTNDSRNLKITPAAVGYAGITVNVNDGTNTTSYIINYAASDPSPVIIPANTLWHTGMSDASDAIALDNDFYISGDDELDVLNVYSRSNSGLPLVSYDYHSLLALPDPSKPEVDVEAAVRSSADSSIIYWTGSMANGKLPYDNKPNRDRLFATTVTGTGNATSFSFSGFVNIRTALLAWGDTNGYNFSASAAPGVDSKGFDGFSLEGMTFGPDGSTLYLGLRAPLVPTAFRHNAVIAPLVNFEAWFNNGSPAGPPVFGAPIELDLNFTGIRDIIKLANGTYIIIAGSPIEQGGVNRMYKWTGYATDAPVEIISSAANVLNWEGAIEVSGSSTSLQIISDGGAQILYGDNNEAKDFADLNLRKFRSDVLTGLDLDLCTGFAATITPSGSTIICPGNNVMLSAPAGANNSYLWSTGETTPSISVSAFQNYSVTVTSTTSGCAATSSAVTLTNALPSDFNADHVVDNIDFLQLLGMFNQPCTGCAPDLNHDGIVNNTDFLILLGQFNQTCP